MLAFGDSCIQNLNGQQRKYFQPYQNNWKYTKCKSLLCLQNGGQCNMQFRYLTQRLCSIQYLRNGNHPDLYSCRLFLTYFECTKNLEEPSAQRFFGEMQLFKQTDRMQFFFKKKTEKIMLPRFSSILAYNKIRSILHAVFFVAYNFSFI